MADEDYQKEENNIEYETIDGKWWKFVNGQPCCQLTDREAVKIIWDTE
jgi:hypothetical protein